MTVALVVEGDTDLPYVRRLAADAGLSPWTEIDCGGKSQLDLELPGYNGAAHGSPWFVLRDLDNDAPCASALVASFDLPPAPWMCLRIAVREIEAWALADRKAIAQFFAVRPMAVPSDPDAEADPTQTLVNLARSSTSVRIQRGMVPAARASVSVGPLYESLIIEFGERAWDLDRASENSASLRKARQRLRELGARWRQHTGG
ncbi:MAG: hypothetical protein KIT72_16145 [Polyangiaceae bacterium]|nr:hypothetical protein [Polyangiaceae bacterium]MCW5791949.1 hypothetical protein [Polyangiaceae bacterium]